MIGKLSKTSTKEAPWHPTTGGLMHYAEKKIYCSDLPSDQRFAEPEWRPNEPFEATVKITGMRRGRSAKYLMCQDSADEKIFYPMFVADLLDLMPKTVILGGVVKGWWRVGKRGSNYGLRFLSAHGPYDSYKS